MVRVVTFFSLCAQGIAAVTAGKAVGHRPRCGRCGGRENGVSDSGCSLREQGGRARMVGSPPIIVDFVNRK